MFHDILQWNFGVVDVATDSPLLFPFLVEVLHVFRLHSKDGLKLNTLEWREEPINLTILLDDGRVQVVMCGKLVNQFKPHVVVMDPITNLIAFGLQADVKSMLTRFTDFLKARQATSLFTSLTAPDPGLEQSQVGISSLMDTWVVVRDIDVQGKRNRSLTIVKSRGMSHSNESREFRLTGKGFLLEEVPPCAPGASSGTVQTPSRIRDRRQGGRVPRLRTTDKEKGR